MPSNANAPGPKKPRKPWPAWAVALCACAVGASAGLAAMEAASRAAPGSGLAVAASQALRAARLGEAAAMRRVFESEIDQHLSRGSFAFSPAIVGLKMTYAAPGMGGSVSRWREGAKPPCRLELSIDGSGAPSLQNAFAGFQGRLDGADPALAPARALASAFTVAHEMGHCALHIQGQAALDAALDAELAPWGPQRSTEDLARSRAFLASPFGQALFHEGFADALALPALARRMDDASFERFAQALLAKRQAGAQIKAPDGRPSPYQTAHALRQALALGRRGLEDLNPWDAERLALRSAALGSLAFLGADAERAKALGLSDRDARAAGAFAASQAKP